MAQRKAADIHPWKIIETVYDPAKAGQYATLFSLANGYLGLRGAHEDRPFSDDGVPDGLRGTFLNGFYDTSPIEYGESAYGFADTAETMQNVADPLLLRLTVDGEVFDIDTAKLDSYERDLAMSYGQLERRLVWTTSGGKNIRIDSRRMVSFAESNIACLVYRVTVLSEDGASIELRSSINGDTANRHGGDDPRLPRGSHEPTMLVRGTLHDPDEELLVLNQQTAHSGLALAVAVAHRAKTGDNVAPEFHEDKKSLHLDYRADLAHMESFELEKYIAFVDSRTIDEEQLVRKAADKAKHARFEGYEALRQAQQAYLDQFWSRAQIRLQGDLALQQGLNFSSFHLLQSAGRDGLTSISAKGLSGEGYEGHYFWDTEMYMFPFFLYTKPDIARALLEYRYAILDQARERAVLMGHKRGALFPWRTISGRECSGYFLAGTAQFHINGDIALAAQKYIQATEDLDFCWEMGLELLLETAVFYLDLGDFDPLRGFVINAVTGPDEYSVLVNNNYYTNLIAKLNMEAALELIRTLAKADDTRLNKMIEDLGYDRSEITAALEQAATEMYFPYDADLGLPLQDEQYADKAPWDFLGADPEKYPLLLHYHPLVIYRHRVSKQADLLMAQYLRPDMFSYEERLRSFHFYELFTTHDSSLSASCHSIMANWLGKSGKAFDYFMETARMDLDNTHGNTADGLHLANMAGNWLALASGYAGMLFREGQLFFHPQLPDAWTGYDFRITYHGALLSLRIEEDQATYELLDGERLRFFHHNTEIVLTPEDAVRQVQLESVVPTEFLSAPVEALLFDVDGVLLRSDEEHYQAWQRLADEEEIYFDRAINQRLRGVSRMASLEIILERSEKEYSPEEKLELAERKNNYYKEAIARLDESALLPGVREFLDKVLACGIRIASASSSKNAPELLANAGISDYFPVQVDGNDIQHSKPHPQVFELAAERLGVSPEHCLVLEDAEAGIEAARAAGMRSIAVGHIAARFLELGATYGAWDLRGINPADL